MEIDIVAECLKPSVFYEELKRVGRISFFELSGSHLKIAKNYHQFKKLVLNRRYDVVYLNIFQGMSLKYADIAKKLGVSNVIAHSHNTALRKSKIYYIKLCLHYIYSKKYAKKADLLCACSKSAAEFMFPRDLIDNSGFLFIPNGIELDKFRFDPAARSLIRTQLHIIDKTVIGNIGRLCYQKNQNFLLDVLSKMQERNTDVVLLLVGDGPDEKKLKDKAESLGLINSVIFYGTTDEPWGLYSAMDIFAFPSFFEGFGIVALEAQASGLPLIYSEYVPDEAIASSNAVCVPIGKGAGAWADAIGEICEKARFLPRKIEETLKQFSVENTCILVGKVLQGKNLCSPIAPKEESNYDSRKVQGNTLQ